MQYSLPPMPLLTSAIFPASFSPTVFPTTPWIKAAKIVEIESCGYRFKGVDPASYPLGEYAFRDELDTKSKYWSGLKPGDVVVDIGSSWGAYSLLALAQGARVVAIDPSPESLEVLLRGAEANGWMDRLTTLRCCVWDDSEPPPKFLELMNRYFHWEGSTGQEGITFQTLDEICESLRLYRIDRIKMDVEGAELQIIRGGKKSLARLKPKLLIEDHDVSLDHPEIHAVPHMLDIRPAVCSPLLELGYEVLSFQPKTGNRFLYASIATGVPAASVDVEGDDYKQWVKKILEEANRAFVPDPDILGYALRSSELVRDGTWVEFGVMTGTSLKRMVTEKGRAKVWGFDSFDGLPEYWREPFPAGSFQMNQIPKIDGAHLVTGLFDDVLRAWRPDTPIHFVHIDCDLYTSARAALMHAVPLFGEKTIVVFDELLEYQSFERHELRALYEVTLLLKLRWKFLATSGEHAVILCSR